MKALILIRHASSGWDSAGQADMDRTLNRTGRKEALQMAFQLKNRGIVPDIFISSPAARAIETANSFLNTFNGNAADLQLLATLYLAEVDTFYKTIESIDGDINVALIFSHNPGITSFINTLDCQPVFNMPACGVYAIQLDTDHWKEFRISGKRFLFFDSPENQQ